MANGGLKSASFGGGRSVNDSLASPPKHFFGLRTHRQQDIDISYPGLHECLLQNCGQARQYEGIYMCDDDCVAPSEWGAGHAMWFATRNGFGTLIEA